MTAAPINAPSIPLGLLPRGNRFVLESETAVVLLQNGYAGLTAVTVGMQLHYLRPQTPVRPIPGQDGEGAAAPARVSAAAGESWEEEEYEEERERMQTGGISLAAELAQDERDRRRRGANRPPA